MITIRCYHCRKLLDDCDCGTADAKRGQFIVARCANCNVAFAWIPLSAMPTYAVDGMILCSKECADKWDLDAWFEKEITKGIINEDHGS